MLQFSLTKKLTILFFVLMGFWFASPNVLPESVLDEMPDWFPRDTINLGLDLQGGSYILLEVDVDTVRSERVENIFDQVRSVLRDNRIRFRDRQIVDERTVQVTISNDEDMETAYDYLEDLSQPVTTNVFVAATQTLDVTQEGNVITLRYTDEGLTEINRRAVEQSVESVRRRIDELGTKEPIVQRQGDTRILVQVPGATVDPEFLQQTAKLGFHLVDINVTPDDILQNRVPPRIDVFPFAVDPALAGEDGEIPDDQRQLVPVESRAAVSGEQLTDANPSFDQRNGAPIVSISFDSRGASAFCQLSQQYVGRQFAIVLDDEIISAPTIQEPICGGRAQISGSFTVESAAELAALLRAGALPAPLSVEEQRSVGPSLGKDSVEAGERAALYGFFAVIFFILVYYRGFGLAANTALIINMILILGALSLLQATLTLPGIAGIVLTIGMAVDANVLVFERVREEARAGKPPMQAVSEGYKSAMSTILDANITTLIAAVVLFQYGTGPIRGFAVTLAIGIITSVFSAVTLTRFMVSVWLKKSRPKALRA